jgi:hypothetical protein
MLKLIQRLLLQRIQDSLMMSKLNQKIPLLLQALIPQMVAAKRLIQLQSLQKSQHLSQRKQIKVKSLNLSNLLRKSL